MPGLEMFLSIIRWNRGQGRLCGVMEAVRLPGGRHLDTCLSSGHGLTGREGQVLEGKLQLSTGALEMAQWVEVLTMSSLCRCHSGRRMGSQQVPALNMCTYTPAVTYAIIKPNSLTQHPQRLD